MNVEHRLISKIIRTQDFRSVQQARITRTMFKSADARQMYKAIQDYYNTTAHFGRTPSRTWMAERFPSFEYVKSRETVGELCEILRKKSMTRSLGLSLEEISQVLEGEGPYEALGLMRTKLVQAQTMIPHSRDVILADSADELIAEYKRIHKAAGLLGVPWPWEELNIQTQGMMPEEFIVLYGRLKSMKTWVGIKIATHAYEAGNRRVMFYSCEMSPQQLRRRVAATLCGIDYDKLRRARLDDKEAEEKVNFKRYAKRLRQLKAEEKRNATKTHKPSFLITSDKEDPAGGGVGHVIAKAEQFEPHLIIVDSFYRMRDDRTGRRSMKWEVQAAITQDLKHAAQRLQVPLIGITQKNRSKEDDAVEGMEDISYTDAAGQEADLGLKIVKNGMDDQGRVSLSAWIAGAREIKTDGFELAVVPSTTWSWQGWIKRSEKRQGPAQGVSGKTKGSLGENRKKKQGRVQKAAEDHSDLDDIELIDSDDEEYDTDGRRSNL